MLSLLQRRKLRSERLNPPQVHAHNKRETKHRIFPQLIGSQMGTTSSLRGHPMSPCGLQVGTGVITFPAFSPATHARSQRSQAVQWGLVPRRGGSGESSACALSEGPHRASASLGEVSGSDRHSRQGSSVCITQWSWSESRAGGRISPC